MHCVWIFWVPTVSEASYSIGRLASDARGTWRLISYWGPRLSFINSFNTFSLIIPFWKIRIIYQKMTKPSLFIFHTSYLQISEIANDTCYFDETYNGLCIITINWLLVYLHAEKIPVQRAAMVLLPLNLVSFGLFAILLSRLTLTTSKHRH